ncbi:MAG: hypothetical protein IPI41_04950 [Flavobacteriales bacterium]|nr:hypothetical protein [Flavobacteriales bacterium]
MEAHFLSVPKIGALSELRDRRSRATEGYVGSGNDNSANYSCKDFWEWDPVSDSWSQRSDIPGQERRHGCAFVISGVPYAGGGWDGTTYFTDFYKYNPGTDTWTPIANYGGVGAYEPVGFAIGARGYAGTGGTSGGDTPQYWQYAPESPTIGIDEGSTSWDIRPYPRPTVSPPPGWSGGGSGGACDPRPPSDRGNNDPYLAGRRGGVLDWSFSVVR